MAKQIDIGLVLEGQDAIDFINYMNDPKPTHTPNILECAAAAKAALKERKYN